MQPKYTLASAIEAGHTGSLKEWVIGFLESEGNNQKLADHIKANPAIVFSPPIEVSLSQLVQLAGAPEDNLQWKDNNWHQSIKQMADSITQGWSPPPLIVTDYFGQPNSLSDGNHRKIALEQAGYTKYWVIYFTAPKQ